MTWWLSTLLVLVEYRRLNSRTHLRYSTTVWNLSSNKLRSFTGLPGTCSWSTASRHMHPKTKISLKIYINIVNSESHKHIVCVCVFLCVCVHVHTCMVKRNRQFWKRSTVQLRNSVSSLSFWKIKTCSPIAMCWFFQYVHNYFTVIICVHVYLTNTKLLSSDFHAFKPRLVSC